MINDISTFNRFLAIMALTAVVVFVALHFVKAGYGMMYTRRWGPTISNRIGWIIMEAPVFVAMLAMWWLSGRRTELVPTVMLIIFEIHYFQRSFVFPLMLRGCVRFVDIRQSGTARTENQRALFPGIRRRIQAA